MFGSLVRRLLLISTMLSCSWCYLQFEPNIVEPLITECDTVKLLTRSPLQYNANIELDVEFTKIADITPQNFNAGDSSRWHIQVCAKNPGSTAVLVKINGSTQIENDGVLHVIVGKSCALKLISVAVGWIYFCAWSMAFYSQIYNNYIRHSVVGLNFDFCWLNVSGFLLYSFYNIGMYYVPLIEKEYLSRHPTGLNPVKFNDVVFSNHAFFTSVVMIYQCYTYEKSDQRISRIMKAILLLYCGIVVVFATVAFMNIIHWLDFLYYCSYVKLSATIMKYIPQALMNYTRKSTVGWSVINVILDFLGGAFSIAQMLIDGYNYDDWGSIFGDPTKFGLGAFTMAFDILFLYQHYILYRIVDKK